MLLGVIYPKCHSWINSCERCKEGVLNHLPSLQLLKKQKELKTILLKSPKKGFYWSISFDLLLFRHQLLLRKIMIQMRCKWPLPTSPSSPIGLPVTGYIILRFVKNQQFLYHLPCCYVGECKLNKEKSPLCSDSLHKLWCYPLCVGLILKIKV